MVSLKRDLEATAVMDRPMIRPGFPAYNNTAPTYDKNNYNNERPQYTYQPNNYSVSPINNGGYESQNNYTNFAGSAVMTSPMSRPINNGFNYGQQPYATPVQNYGNYQAPVQQTNAIPTAYGYNESQNAYSDVDNLANRQIVMNASQEYRNYLWNELKRNDNRPICTEEEFYANGLNQSYTNGYSNDLDELDINSFTPAKNIKAKRQLNIKGKIALGAYFLFIGIIVLLIALTSPKQPDSVNASVTSNENANIGQSVTEQVTDAFYADKTQIKVNNIAESDLLAFGAQATQDKQTNWFDSFCDFIENVVGG